jgi:anti-sigma factor RsiW
MTDPANETPRLDEATLLVHAHVDGELDPANALAVERQIAANPALAAERARIEALRNVLSKEFPREALPPRLQTRIEAAVGLRRAAVTGPSWRALAASVALGMVLASGSTWLILRPVSGDRVAEEAVDDHMRALMATQPFDVASSDRHTVKPWFNGRIPQAPRVVDLAPEGFTLVGGRIDVIGRTPVPTLVYRVRKHLISLLAVPAAGRTVDAIMRRSINGYNLVGWTQDGVTYWAVSDVAASDLEKFAQLFRAAPADG